MTTEEKNWWNKSQVKPPYSHIAEVPLLPLQVSKDQLLFPVTPYMKLCLKLTLIHRWEICGKKWKQDQCQGLTQTHAHSSIDIPLWHPLWGYVGGWHWHTDTDSQIIIFRKIKAGSVPFLDTATCPRFICYPPVTPSMRLWLRLTLTHWHWFTNKNFQKKIQSRISANPWHSHMP